MKLLRILLGYYYGGSHWVSPSVPGQPLLTAYLRHRGKLELTVTENEQRGRYWETAYDLSVNGEHVGKYRVRKQGSFLRELVLGDEGHVVRNIFVDVPEEGLNMKNFNGTYIEDFRRLLFDYEKATIFTLEARLQDHGDSTP